MKMYLLTIFWYTEIILYPDKIYKQNRNLSFNWNLKN